MSRFAKIQGLVAATHTPFDERGELSLDPIATQAEHLVRNGVKYAFIGGTTGESSSLTVEERKKLAVRWLEVSKGSELQVIVHVGSNSLQDAVELAKQAQHLGATATSALAPSYFKPANAATLAQSMATIAAAAPELPFYYYEIPSMTGLGVSPSAFLSEAADRIPNLAGLKFTSNNLMEYQLCLRFDEGVFDVPFGFDEMLLGALALGAQGAVGSSFNFAAPVYHQVVKAFDLGDLETAREYQFRSVCLIQILASYGYMGAAKATMKMLGVDVGSPRLPNATLSADRVVQLQRDLEKLGFFDWVGAALASS